MLRPIIFTLLYLRNWWAFDGNHVRIKAATHMDMDLRLRARRHRQRPRGTP